MVRTKDAEDHSKKDEQAYKFDKGAEIGQKRPADTGGDSNGALCDDEDFYLESFQEIRSSIDLGKLKDFAISVRKKQVPGSSQLLDCEVCARPTNGTLELGVHHHLLGWSSVVCSCSWIW